MQTCNRNEIFTTEKLFVNYAPTYTYRIQTMPRNGPAHYIIVFWRKTETNFPFTLDAHKTETYALD